MSVTEQGIAPQYLHRIEFHFDRLKAVVIGTSAILAGISIALPPAARRAFEGAPLEMGAASVALAGATTLVAVGLYILMRILLWRGPAVVIDNHGIHDRRTGAVMTPWSSIHDIRVLDRHGHHIGIDTLASGNAADPRLPALLRRRHAEPLTVIDTFFLRSKTGNRILDFVMPLTALTPLDMSETPVSEKSLSADATFARNRLLSVSCFVAVAGLLPAAAAILTVA